MKEVELMTLNSIYYLKLSFSWLWIQLLDFRIAQLYITAFIPAVPVSCSPTFMCKFNSLSEMSSETAPSDLNIKSFYLFFSHRRCFYTGFRCLICRTRCPYVLYTALLYPGIKTCHLHWQNSISDVKGKSGTHSHHVLFVYSGYNTATDVHCCLGKYSKCADKLHLSLLAGSGC